MRVTPLVITAALAFASACGGSESSEVATATPATSFLSRPEVFERCKLVDGRHLRRAHATESQQKTLEGMDGRRIFGLLGHHRAKRVLGAFRGDSTEWKACVSKCFKIVYNCLRI